MPKLWNLLRSDFAPQVSNLTDLAAAKSMSFAGMTYPLFGYSSSGQPEEIESSFMGHVQGAYKSDGVVFAVILARMLLFSEARFTYQRFNKGRPGEMFGDASLQILETPYPNGTTGEMLARADQDVSLGGNWYLVREKNRLRRLRPDWVSIILSAPPDQAVESDVMGYLYRPGGTGTGRTYLPEEVVHWSPIPDPEAMYRGMSWVTPVLREIQADKAATDHKARFFENAATPNLAVAFKESVTEDQFREFVDAHKAANDGYRNAYKTMFLAGGADVTVVGADMKQLDFKVTQGAGETRICAAGGVPPIIVGLSEGLQASTYSNYGMARRKFGDHWARPQWRSICGPLAKVVPVPSGCRLWYDDRDIPFLYEDAKDRTEIAQGQVTMIARLAEVGADWDTAVKAVTTGDLSLLAGAHSGLFSVQLQPPGSPEADAAAEAAKEDDGAADPKDGADKAEPDKAPAPEKK
jgi:phage portal protein BeeE